MGNFEKLSVLVIGVIIVMILVVALYTWTDDPSADDGTDPGIHRANQVLPVVDDLPDDRLQRRDDPIDWSRSGFVDPNRDVDPIDPKPVNVIDPDKIDEDRPGPDDVILDDEDDEIVGGDPAVERKVTVKQGETLGLIAQRELGSVRHTAALAARNNIPDPAKIRVGMELIIPVVADGAPLANKPSAGAVASGPAKPGAAYKVRSGDTIQKISQAAYGTIERWTDIWFANIERVEDPRFLREGMDLSLPN